MKRILSLLLFIGTALIVHSQNAVELKDGTVSYITSQNVYTKFQTTERISAGDTLFIFKDSKMIPVLIVKDLSSVSCVCSPISTTKLTLSDKVVARVKIIDASKPVETAVATKATVVAATADTNSVKKQKSTEPKQSITGRISVSSYTDFSSQSDVSERLRYTFSLNANNIANSKLSGEAYISFAHKINEWDIVKSDIYNGLKIYSLAMNYAFNKKNIVWFGRKINNRISNVGAIDGLQYETKFGAFTAGVFAGTRPDYMDYSFNSKLLQYGGYLSHDYSNSKGSMQTSLAFVEQTNDGFTDRRFAYIQHSNSLLPKLYFFGSVECDLYKKVLNTQDSTYTQDNSPTLSNVYVSLRYKVVKQLSLSLSYSSRQNIIYYETYKNILDQLLEKAATQGYMGQVNFYPGKYMAIGVSAGYRFSKLDPKPSENLYTYFTYANLPWLKASATISATLLQTSYVNGSIYSIGLSRDMLKGKLNGGVSYRYVKYNYVTDEIPLIQNMAELNLTCRITKKLFCSFNYEGTFEKSIDYERFYVNLTQRF
jgi:hypothetical protein